MTYFVDSHPCCDHCVVPILVSDADDSCVGAKHRGPGGEQEKHSQGSKPEFLKNKIKYCPNICDTGYLVFIAVFIEQHVFIGTTIVHTY